MKMDKTAVIKAVNAEIERAESFMDNRISKERAIAYDYYYGKPLGTEVDGRSQVVSCDVAQVVDSCLPALLKIFVSGDKAVEFTPRGPEDVKSAEQATMSCNYVFFTQNNGYALAHDFIKDGLLQKTGVLKWKWDDSVVMHEKRYQGLDDGTLQVLSKDPSYEIIEHSEYPAQVDPAMLQGPPPMLHDVTVRVKKEAGKVDICVPPPEEILISPDSMTLDVMDMPFIAHTPMLTASDLIEMGISQSVIDTLPEGDRDKLAGPESIARNDRNDATALVLGDDGADDSSQAVYRYNECYIRIDVDGDGVAELRKICMVGDEVLHNEPVDHIPMCIWTPKAMPHEVVGMSLADEVVDIQLLKSTIWRGAMDNMYLSIAPRMFAQGDINLDDVMTVKPGGIIRGGPDASLTPVVVPSLIGEAFQMLEYADQEEEVRTGISRMFQGIDPQAINKTATGVNALLNQANARVELMARNAAEFGFKPLFKGIMYLLAKHQQQALMVRLNNNFVPVDPETWSKEYDMSCNVGLGMGTKDQQLMQLQAMGMDLQMISQSPFAQQLITAKNVFNYMQKKAELAGFKDVTPFVSDPEGQPPPQPPKPPEIQKAEMQIEADKQKFQAQSQLDQQKFAAQAQMDQQSAQAQLMADQEKAARDGELQMQKAQIDAAVARYKADLDAQVKLQIEQMKAQMQHEVDMCRAHYDGQTGMKQAEMMGANGSK
jgi:hypothetical protein